MNKKDVVRDFIKIDAVRMMRILKYSGLNLKMIRTGNKYHSTRKTVIPNPNLNKRHWPVVIFSYSSVVDPRGYYERELYTSEIYLNPEFKYLLDI